MNGNGMMGNIYIYFILSISFINIIAAAATAAHASQWDGRDCHLLSFISERYAGADAGGVVVINKFYCLLSLVPYSSFVRSVGRSVGRSFGRFIGGSNKKVAG